MSRIGFYGGSFDPPHVGHQATALYAMECANISELIVAPIYVHPDGKQLAPFFDRVRMTAELMDPLRALKPIRVSLIEEEVARYTMAVYPGGKVGRTIDTLVHLMRPNGPYAEATIVLVLGSDIKAAFPHWDGHELLEMMQMAGNIEVFWVDRVGDLSSTKVREAIRSGASTERMLPKRTRRYIDEKGLYL